MNPFGALVILFGTILVIIGTRNTQDRVWNMLTGKGAPASSNGTQGTQGIPWPSINPNNTHQRMGGNPI